MAVACLNSKARGSGNLMSMKEKTFPNNRIQRTRKATRLFVRVAAAPFSHKKALRFTAR